MLKNAKKFEEDKAPSKPEGRAKSIGNGRMVILCDEPDCPCSSDLDMGRQYCIFHYSVDFDARRYATQWLKSHRVMVELAKMYDRFGILDDDRIPVLEAFVQECVTKGYYEVAQQYASCPNFEPPFNVRPINVCLGLCTKYAHEKAEEAKARGIPVEVSTAPTRRDKVKGLISRLVAKTRFEEREAEKKNERNWV